MATLTHGLETIELGATAWRVILNNNLTSLDVGRVSSGLHASRPGSFKANRYYYSTDRKILAYDNGSGYTDFSNLIIVDAADTAPGRLDEKIQNSIVADTVNHKIHLSGDAASPGVSKYWGTGGAGIKGFFDVPGTSPAGVFGSITVSGFATVSGLKVKDDDGSHTLQVLPSGLTDNKTIVVNVGDADRTLHIPVRLDDRVQQSIEGSFATGKINLAGDEASPGVDKYYGTNAGGTKGFHILPTQVTAFGSITVSGFATVSGLKVKDEDGSHNLQILPSGLTADRVLVIDPENASPTLHIPVRTSEVKFAVSDVLLGRQTAGAGLGELIPLTAAGRSVISGANAAAQRVTLGITDDGWLAAGSFAYASATTITVASGAASIYRKGDKIKLTQTTVKYFYIRNVADTLLTVTGGSDYAVADAAITSPFYSHTENPIGFPGWFNVTAPVFDVTSYDDGAGGQPTTTECRFKISGSQYTVHYRGNGLKGAAASTNILVSSTTFPTPANTTNVTALGLAIVYIADPAVLGIVCNNGFTIYLSATVIDNAVIAHFGFTITYEF